jgi:outer membrane receptor protein involved in Fe transport
MKKLCVCLFLAALSGLAYGDDQNGSTLEPIVVTPDRTLVEEARTPSDVTVISQQEIQDSGAQSLGELLDGSVGVHVYNDGEAKTDKVDIRGFADTSVSNILVLVDGHKINSIDISGPDLTQIPIEEIEKIEVIRGASSVLYGDNAVGGVVNIITKQGCGKISGSVEYDGGSYGASTEDVSVGGSEKGLSYQMNQKYADSKGYRANSNMLAKDYDGKFSYSITDALSLNSNIVWHQDEYGLPGDLTPEGLAAIGRRGSSFPQNYDHASTQDKMFSLGLDDKSFLGDISLDTSYRNKDTYAYFDEDPYGASDVKYDITTVGVLGKDIYKGVILGHDFKIVAGVDYYNSQNRILGGGSGLSEDFDNIVVQMNELGVYDNNTLWLTDKLSVNAGYRYEYAQYTFNDKGNDLKTIKDANAPVGGAGITYEYAPGSNVHASVQQTFRFLATDEWYSTYTGLNTNLKQQTGIQYEVGLKHNLNDITSVTVTPYWINNKNEILYDPYNVYYGSNNNYGHTQRIGVEAGQETNLLKILPVRLDKLTFNTSFTYQDPIFISGPYNHSTIPGVPDTQATAGFNVGFLKHFTFTANERFTGQEYAIDDVTNETARAKQYWTTDLKLSYKLKMAELFVAVDNLFNEYYNDYTVMSTVDTDKVYYPAPGRTVFGGIKLKF